MTGRPEDWLSWLVIASRAGVGDQARTVAEAGVPDPLHAEGAGAGGRDKDDRGIVQYDLARNQQALETWPGIWDEQGTMYAVYDFLDAAATSAGSTRRSLGRTARGRRR